MEHSPLEQFTVHRFGAPVQFAGIDVSMTNASLWMIIILLGVSAFLILGMRRQAVVPGRWQSLAELSYEFVAKMMHDTVGSDGKQYFPFVFTLFMFILFANMFGMIPGSFTVTSHIIVTAALAMVVFIGATIIAFLKHGTKFLGFFVPKGVPAALLVVLVPIEIISYFTRPLSLSVRLFANMMAGHTMLKVFGSFVVMLGVWGFFPLLMIVAFTALEFLVAFLQAYVFAILTCIYLNDALHLHH